MYDDTDEWDNGQGFTAGLICTPKPGLICSQYYSPNFKDIFKSGLKCPPACFVLPQNMFIYSNRD